MRTLIQLSFVVDLDTIDEVAELVNGMEQKAAEAISASLSHNGAKWEDLQDRVEYYGASAIPMRTTLGDRFE